MRSIEGHSLARRICLVINIVHPPPCAQLYLSQEQSKTMAGNNSQGAVYKVYSSVGPDTSPDSKFSTSASSGFSKSTRAVKYGGSTPGPGENP